MAKTYIEDLDIRIEPLLVEFYPASGKQLKLLHWQDFGVSRELRLGDAIRHTLRRLICSFVRHPSSH